jgi:plastocyanin
MYRSFIFICLVLFVTACQRSSSGGIVAPTNMPPTPHMPPSPLATAVQSTSGLLVGVYDNNDTPHGAQTLTLLGGSRYIQEAPAYHAIITGTWAISGSQIVFTETETVPPGHACVDAPGIYNWTFDGQGLTLVLANDDCRQRKEDYPSGPWIKQSQTLAAPVPPKVSYGQSITIEATDRLTFVPDTITVASGQTVELLFVNHGKLPHTFTLPDLNIEVQIPPGETNLLTFTTPTPGEYPFYSNVLTEFENMKGKLIVK